MKPAATHPRADSFFARRGTRLAGGLLALATAAAYCNSFSGPFVLDDVASIAEKNPTLFHLWPIWPVLSPPGGLSVSGRPLLNLSLAVNYAIGGTNVWSYHALNLAIHILAGLALFGLVRRTLLRPALRERFGAAALPLALAAAALWVLHPLQTEAVTYIIQRAESMMGLFYLLTMYAFVRGAESPAPGRWYAASIGSCLLGMASKEVIASAPLMVLLYDRTFVAGTFRAAVRQRPRFYLCLAGTWLWLGYLIMSTGGNRNGSVGFNVGVGWWAYALTQFEAIVRYLRLSFWPHPLVFEYGTFWVRQAVTVAPQAIVVVLLVAGTVVALWRRPPLGFLGAWFLAMLAPTSLVPGTTQMIVEHRMYLSLAAVVVPVVLGIYRLAGKRSVIVLVALATGLGWATSRRNEDYRTDTAIWGDTVAKRPGNAIAHNALGYAWTDMPGRLAAAIVELKAAVRLDPDYPQAHNNLGIALEKAGQPEQAVTEYQTALRLKPDYPEAHNNYGITLARRGRMAEAVAQFEAALSINPDYAGAHNSMGNVLANMGRLDEAVSEYDEAVRLRPDYAQAYYNAGLALAHLPGRADEAIAHFDAAIRLKPDYAEAYNDLGVVFMNLNRQPEAIAQFEHALQFKPGNAETRNNLGIALAKSGRTTEAISQFEAAVRADANYAEAHCNLGLVLMNLPGRQTDAMIQFKAALRLKPGIEPARQIMDHWPATQK